MSFLQKTWALVRKLVFKPRRSTLSVARTTIEANFSPFRMPKILIVPRKGNKSKELRTSWHNGTKVRDNDHATTLDYRFLWLCSNASLRQPKGQGNGTATCHDPMQFSCKLIGRLGPGLWYRTHRSGSKGPGGT